MDLPSLGENQFAVGLITTTLLAALLAYLRNVPSKLLELFWAQFAVHVEIKNTDPVFDWISLWLNQQPYSKKTRRLMVRSYHKESDNTDPYEDVPEKKQNRPTILFTPATGEHVFWYKGHLIWLGRTKSDSPVTKESGFSSTMMDRESFNIWVLGRSQNAVREIIDDAMQLALPADVPETFIIPSSDGRWQSPIRRPPRSSTSVILEGDVINDLIIDAKRFLGDKDWYNSLGIPYRRGYLLHGTPGSGKTSAVLALAGALSLDVYMLNLGDRYLDDGRLNYLLTQVPAGNIVLLEDIDATFQSREKTGDAKERHTDSGVTFSGLLNALDGVAAREGRLLFMTTNHRQLLDPALIRPGRADMHVEFGYATSSQATRMFSRFFPDADHELAYQFGHLTPKDAISMAAIQDHLLTHKTDPVAALTAWAQQHQKAPSN